MGVIRWEVTEYRGGTVWLGYLGDTTVCDVTFERSDSTVKLLLYPSFPWPALKNGRPTNPACYECVGSVEDGRDRAEALLQEWLADVGLVPKAEFDEARESGEHLVRELRASFATSKRRHDEIRDLRAENAVLKERIGTAFGDIDDAITALKRKVDDIVADTGVDRSYSWDVPVDQWWKGAKPKQRTEADFRNADIDQTFHVTFRDGGAA